MEISFYHLQWVMIYFFGINADLQIDHNSIIYPEDGCQLHNGHEGCMDLDKAQGGPD